MVLRFHYSMVSMSERRTLREAFGSHLKENEPLAKYTSARMGGPAEYFVIAETAEELAEYTRTAWDLGFQPLILGGGANILVSDAGVHGLVILNRARRVEFRTEDEPATVWAESGTNLGLLARQCVAKGLSGLEWAATVPGTVGYESAHGRNLASRWARAPLDAARTGVWLPHQHSQTAERVTRHPFR
jgi:UDP-N-acetylmuramate dehydrogenase